MDPQLRDFFDLQLDQVLQQMPQRVHDLLAEVPLFVEDYPPRSILDKLGLARRDQLCGLYTGVPLDARSGFDAPRMPDVVTIYREGILNISAGDAGELTESELHRQIRITLLHELGHHHGLDEEELSGLGYG